MVVIKLTYQQYQLLHFHQVTFNISKYNHLLFVSTDPTSSVGSVNISSVEARSMRVSWDEVPCNGQNGPITGYLLFYITSDIVNITGGDMIVYMLTSLTPYTNYSVRVRPYNDGGIGPTSNTIIQQTSEDSEYILNVKVT